MNPILKGHLISALQTFIATFIIVFGTTLSQGEVVWSSAFWASLALVAVRAGVKEVIARFAPLSLGGRK